MNVSIYRAVSTMGTPERLQEFALRERRGRVMRMYAGGEVAKRWRTYHGRAAVFRLRDARLKEPRQRERSMSAFPVFPSKQHFYVAILRQ